MTWGERGEPGKEVGLGVEARPLQRVQVHRHQLLEDRGVALSDALQQGLRGGL